MADFKYDVFISYSHKDEKWADKVLRQRLDDAGLKVCIDYRDFEAGKMAILNMQDAAKESKHVVLVITRNWLNSEWSLFEALMGGTEDPAGLQKKLIPLLCEDGIQKDINPFIAMRTWVDFTRKDREEIAWKQLSDAIGKPATFEIRPATVKWFFGHRYGDIENFTGRATELKMLDEWLSNDKDNLLVLRALGGFGKSILTWQWFNNHVDKTKWQTAVWWSFYEKESGFESFLSETLKHLGVEVKESARQQVNDLLEAMRGTNILIVLDGFERLLRQYGKMDAALQSDDEDADIDPSQRDCSSPLTETFLRGLSGAGTKSKVLMTTRLCPRVLESADGKLLKGCRDEALSAFSPEDAVTYFHNEGIKATRAEILAACSAYGYHPLSLSLLVGLINEDHEHRGDIAAVKNLEIFEDVKARRHHVLERAYESLAPERRDLLSKISCFRGSMEYAVLKKVFPSPDLDKALLDLRKRGLLQYAGETQRYDMHPIVRHYAYDRFTDSERKTTHKNLVFYFIDVMIDAMPTPNTKVKTLEDLAPVIELYHHMVRAGNLDEALKLYSERLANPLYFQFGSYHLEIELLRVLFLDGEDKLPRLKNESAQAWTLNTLATSYSLSGQPRRAVPLFEMVNALKGDKKNLARRLGNVATQQLVIGSLSAAERNNRRRIELTREIVDEYSEAIGHQELGRVLSYRGVWQEAGENLLIAQKVFEKEGPSTNFGSVNLSYLALRDMLLLRTESTKQQYLLSALNFCKRALEWSDNTTKIRMEIPRDYVRAHWLLGAAYRANNELTLSEENLSKALNLCRQINMVDHEADILLDLARLHYFQGDFKDAQEKASEALMITERSGYVLQGADVHLLLATLALEGFRSESLKVLSDKDAAIHHAKEALRLANCDDGPPYYYKVAYEEAERMLERLKV
ncbi:MAG: toll/interleukin-1 receptor domain-containing protein [Anaerolineales bacterium]|nr:toll/interleukin-1 receptor domain-containing protein [Anaerolineales bacterium]